MHTTGWVPLALSRSIEAGTSAGAVLDSAEIVVWRDNSGHPHAWEDRCPHRGMKLSFGFVRGDHIACLYHGWEFGATGQCRKIPAHPALEVPRTICAQTYAVTEAGGMIWVHAPLGQGDPGPLPPEEPGTGLRSLYIDAPLERVLQALPQIMGGSAHRNGALLDLDCNGLKLRIGLQPVDAGRCALHVVTRETPATPVLLGLLDQLQQLRHSAETAVREVTA